MCACQRHRIARLGIVVVLGLLLVPSRALGEPLDPATGQAVAAAFVHALNDGDDQSVVALFDIQATVAADRMAWLAQDIRQWVQLQVAERIRIEPTSAYEVVGNRVKWTARVFRRDWRQQGVDPLEVWDSVLVDRKRILAFMSQPSDVHVAALLGDSWRPDEVPGPLREQALEQSSFIDPATAAAALGLLAILGLLGWAAASRRASRNAGRRTPPSGGEMMLARLKDFSEAHNRTRFLELLVVVCTTLLLASSSGSASAAPEQAPVLTKQNPSDPLVVVDNFLAARNARDAGGATFFCARLLAIYDVEGKWIVDEPMVKAWLQQLTDTYLIDTVVRPRADGERVVWVERLTRRSLPYREALASSVEVTVEVVVQGGSITSYSALYPVLASQLSGAGTGSKPSGPAADAPGIPVMTLFVAWAVGLAAAALIVTNVAPAVWHARHRTPKVRL